MIIWDNNDLLIIATSSREKIWQSNLQEEFSLEEGIEEEDSNSGAEIEEGPIQGRPQGKIILVMF